MYQVLKGFRAIDVSMFAFGPTAGAVLADWGADVIKIMHPQYVDPLQHGGIAAVLPPARKQVSALWEVVNRGKRCIALDIARPEGRAVLVELLRTADVFITSFLPAARRKLRIDIEDIRTINPRIIYARASGFGPRGPEGDKPGFDHTAFWARSGIAHANMQIADEFIPQLSPAFGDILSGFTLASGVTAALLQRERTGEAAVVDVSLMATAMFALAPSIVAADIYGIDAIPRVRHAQQPNALATAYRTRDGRYLYIIGVMTEAAWRNLCECIGRPGLADDPRFNAEAARAANSAALVGVLDDIFASRTLAEWQQALKHFESAWCEVQSARELHDDPQAIANEYIVPVESAQGELFPLVASPVQFDRRGTALRRAPLPGEHTEEVLRELGKTADEIAGLKAGKAVV
jgi:crotonobetainyl-CoA:carnitine CoA-transferase CaiB-like acyl-CoA transferase